MGKEGRDNRFEPRVESPKEHSQCAAARATHSSHACSIHFRPAKQVVESSFGVPDEVAGHALANEDALGSRVYMLVDRPTGRRRLELGVVGLLPFALSDRVETQHHETL